MTKFSRANKFNARRAYRCLACGAAGTPIIIKGKRRCPLCEVGEMKHFASQLEARRYDHLRLRERCGEIRDLQCHPRLPIYVRGHHVCDVEADFSYVEDGRGLVIEDTKGGPTDTPISRLKRKMVAAYHGIEIQIVRSARA